MFVLVQFFQSLALLFKILFKIIYFILVARVIISWFGVNPYNEIIQVILRISEPILAPFRKLRLQVGMIDFSPILAFILIFFLENLIVGILNELVSRLSH